MNTQRTIETEEEEREREREYVRQLSGFVGGCS
jgi:hypothetical protein